ncbi:hypothetical protein [uncultured Intestinimonas sp.]|uniref:hypothetical protein n=1 Tax=uncultured Intestinimonas sp. TaxID=1689265 RepID=UPI0025D18B53|nr:hypothetical protein [uncultured Intestinimonas sp.]
MPDTETTSFSLKDLTKNSTLTTNVKQDCFVTTYDKVKLVLIEYEDNKKLAQNWWNYLSMAISFGLPCFTSEFKPFLFFSAEFLESSFKLAAITFTVLTIVSTIKRIVNRKKVSIDYCASRIKSSEIK